MTRTIPVLAVLLLACVGLAHSQTHPQQAAALTPPRDSQAVTLLTSALAQMGGTAPTDSTANGTVKLTAGSRVESGTITIMTRGLTQTREDITVPSGKQSFIYDNGYASDNLNGAPVKHSGELGASAQSPFFPLALLASANGSSDVAIAYIGTETVNGTAAAHIRLWNIYGGLKARQDLLPLSQRDIWLSSTSFLPVKISYSRHIAGGASAPVQVDVFLSDYRTVNGALYPFQIQKSVNGTPWAAITIQSVVFNTSLPATDFTVQ